MRWVTIVVSLVVIAAVGACAPKQNAHNGSTLTEHQRDSVLSRSGLPGTSTIGRASATSDAEARRAAEMNAQIDSLPH